MSGHIHDFAGVWMALPNGVAILHECRICGEYDTCGRALSDLVKYRDQLTDKVKAMRTILEDADAEHAGEVAILNRQTQWLEVLVSKLDASKVNNHSNDSEVQQ